jgi:long-chain acyl-CoA synthetase
VAAATRDPARFDQRIDAGTGEQIAFLASTAGSTGAPRLVAMRHDAIVKEVRTPRQWLPLHPGDRALSVVSLANHGERLLATKAMLMHESLLHLPENATTVFNDMVEVAPHFLFAPPRFFEKLQGLTELFMQEALPIARAAYAASLSGSRHGWWQRRTRDRIRGALGLGNVRLALTSGASSPSQVGDWFAAIGVPLLDCYGLAEAGLCTDAQLKLASDGEILVRGADLRSGYWVRGEICDPPTDSSGWLRTGDLGRVDAQGRVRLLGRVGTRVVAAGGEPISPEIAEDALRLSAYIADAVVLPGEDGRLAALLALDEERIRKHAQQQRLPFTDYASLLRLAEIDSLIAAQVEIANGRLSANHRVRSVQVIPRSLQAGDEELTPAMRLNRSVVAHRYVDLKPTGVCP